MLTQLENKKTQKKPQTKQAQIYPFYIYYFTYPSLVYCLYNEEEETKVWVELSDLSRT